MADGRGCIHVHVHAGLQDGGKAFDVSKLPKGIGARRGRPGTRAPASAEKDKKKDGKDKDKDAAPAPRVKKVRLAWKGPRGDARSGLLRMPCRVRESLAFEGGSLQRTPIGSHMGTICAQRQHTMLCMQSIRTQAALPLPGPSTALPRLFGSAASDVAAVAFVVCDGRSCATGTPAARATSPRAWTTPRTTAARAARARAPASRSARARRRRRA